MRISPWLAAASAPMDVTSAAEVPDESDPFPWGLLGLFGLLGLLGSRRKHDNRTDTRR
jgi:MYXO-CTERM domain-containing protein